MIREALEYLMSQGDFSQETYKDGEGHVWYDRQRYSAEELIPKKWYPDCLRLTTLSSLVDYYQANVNKIQEQGTLVVIEAPGKVCVYTLDDERCVRTKLIEVRNRDCCFGFKEFQDMERFIIGVQAAFIQDKNRDLLLDFASKVQVNNGTKIEDDGAKQVVTVKTGIASLAKGVLPNPLELRPYRTFMEVEQPKSSFVFRMRDDGTFALFEADGGAWELEAVRNVAKFLEELLKDIRSVTVLA